MSEKKKDMNNNIEHDVIESLENLIMLILRNTEYHERNYGDNAVHLWLSPNKQPKIIQLHHIRLWCDSPVCKRLCSLWVGRNKFIALTKASCTCGGQKINKGPQPNQNTLDSLHVPWWPSHRHAHSPRQEATLPFMIYSQPRTIMTMDDCSSPVFPILARSPQCMRNHGGRLSGNPNYWIGTHLLSERNTCLTKFMTFC